MRRTLNISVLFKMNDAFIMNIPFIRKIHYSLTEHFKICSGTESTMRKVSIVSYFNYSNV